MQKLYFVLDGSNVECLCVDIECVRGMGDGGEGGEGEEGEEAGNASASKTASRPFQDRFKTVSSSTSSRWHYGSPRGHSAFGASR